MWLPPAGLCIPVHIDISQCADGIIISETNFNTMTAQEVGAMMVSRQADGFILLASIFPFGNEVLARAEKRSQPVVIGCETISASLADIPRVHIDNVAAAQDATVTTPQAANGYFLCK